MSQTQQLDLMGYLLDAIEPEERDAIEARLASEPALLAELESLRGKLAPLAADRAPAEPPPGLAERTLAAVARQRRGNSCGAAKALDMTAAAGAAASSVIEPVMTRRSWRRSDVLVAASVCVVGVALMFPLLNTVIANSQITTCASKLRELGLAMTDYSDRHAGIVPVAADHGKLAAAGVCAPTLFTQRYLHDSRQVVCPASNLAGDAHFEIPSLEKIEQADGVQLVELKQKMGGSYGYVLGYRTDGVYHPVRNLRRPTFPLASDLPVTAGETPNHGGLGRNVLLEDGHVTFLKGDAAQIAGSSDNIFYNDLGQIAAGCTPSDAVLCPSDAAP